MLWKMDIGSGVLSPTREQCEHLKSIIETGEECTYALVVHNRFCGCRVILEQVDISGDALYSGELSLDFFVGTNLIVERVFLTKQRCGTFTKVMKYLYSAVQGTSVDTIEIQSVLTDEMVSWCKRYGFTQVKGHTYDERGRGGSYTREAQSNPLLE